MASATSEGTLFERAEGESCSSPSTVVVKAASLLAERPSVALSRTDSWSFLRSSSQIRSFSQTWLTASRPIRISQWPKASCRLWNKINKTLSIVHISRVRLRGRRRLRQRAARARQRSRQHAKPEARTKANHWRQNTLLHFRGNVNLSSSWPGLSRPSRLDGHCASLSGMPGTRPGMTAFDTYASRSVIRMPGQDRRRPVKLFEQHDPHQLMWPCRCAEREFHFGLVAQ